MNILRVVDETLWGGAMRRTDLDRQRNWAKWLDDAVGSGFGHVRITFGFFCLDISAYGALR